MKVKESDVRRYVRDPEKRMEDVLWKWLLKCRIRELEERIEELENANSYGNSYRIERSEIRNVLSEDITDIRDVLLALEMAEEELSEEYIGRTMYVEDLLKKWYETTAEYFIAA